MKTSKLREKIYGFVSVGWFPKFILFVIVVNAVLLGLETIHGLSASASHAIHLGDKICLGIFIVELALKIYAYGRNFHKDPWNVFDFAIVAVALVPSFGPFAVLRVLRIFRILKLVSGIPRLRIIVQAILETIPSIGWVALLLAIIYYVFAVIGTMLFGAQFPEFFGSIPKTMYTLFQVMTLESWSMGISRPVMEVFPYAYVYFVPFILVTSFIVLNVVIGIVCSAISSLTQREGVERARKRKSALGDIDEKLYNLNLKMLALTQELEELTVCLKARESDPDRTK